MERFPIPNFRATETKDDAQNQDRTVLRRAEGVVCIPRGALSGPPTWKELWGLDDLGSQITTALAGADNTKTHFVTVAHGSHKLLIAWSLARGEPVGLFHVGTSGTDTDFDGATSVTIAAPSGAPWRDHDGQLPWYPSLLGTRLVLGNGVGANLTWTGSAIAAFAPAGTPGIHDPAKEAFPPCLSFAIGPDNVIYATGNAALPLRVWVARPPNPAQPDIDGIYSVDTSFVDILLKDATRTTALSVWQNYVTVHTDKGPVNLFAPDGDYNTGQKARQAPSAANHSAPNPNCAYDALGHSPFYFGANGEVFTDQATRTGPSNKRQQLDLDIATAEAAGDWNRAMVNPIDTRYSAALFDRDTRLFWIFTRTTIPSDRSALWCYDDRGDNASGPFRYPNAAAVTVLRGFTKLTVAVVITAAGQLLYANLSNVRALEAWEREAPGTALGSAYEEKSSAPTPDTGVPYVAMNAAGTAFAQTVAGKRIELASPWAEWTETSALTLTRYFNNAHLGIVELGHLDCGAGETLKQFLETRTTWAQLSRACVGIYAEGDGGNRSGRWFGSVFDLAQFDRAMAPHALLGVRLRIRLLVLFFNSQPRAELKGLSVGYVGVGTV